MAIPNCAELTRVPGNIAASDSYRTNQVRNTFTHRFADAFWPYALDHIEHNDWILLNRFYKPLGMQTVWPYVHYRFDKSIITFARKPSERQLISICHDPEYGVHREENGSISRVYLQPSGASPDEHYMKRLEQLLNWKTLEPVYLKPGETYINSYTNEVLLEAR